MVGLIKQLIDELGMDAITAPARQGTPPHRFPQVPADGDLPGTSVHREVDESGITSWWKECGAPRKKQLRLDHVASFIVNTNHSIM